MLHSIKRLSVLLEKEWDRVVASLVLVFSAWGVWTTFGLLLGLIEPSPGLHRPEEEVQNSWWGLAVAFIFVGVAAIGLFVRKRWARLIFGILAIAIASYCSANENWYGLAVCGTFGLQWLSQGLGSSQREPVNSLAAARSYKNFADFEARYRD